jgi:hypothetical protein
MPGVHDQIGRPDVGERDRTDVRIQGVQGLLDVRPGAVAAGVVVQPALPVGAEAVPSDGLRDLPDQVGARPDAMPAPCG